MSKDNDWNGQEPVDIQQRRSNGQLFWTWSQYGEHVIVWGEGEYLIIDPEGNTQGPTGQVAGAEHIMHLYSN